MSSTFRKKKASSASSSASSSLCLKGCKPWTGGVALTSTGLREWDSLLIAGGQPLGTCLLLEEDRWTSLALTLVKYWCAEALSQEQHLLIPVDNVDEKGHLDLSAMTPSSWTADSDDEGGNERDDCVFPSDIRSLLASLPKNLHKGKDLQQRSAEQTTNNEGETDSTPGLETLAEEEDDEEGEETAHAEAEAEDGLRNAWQYRKSVQQERSGQSNKPQSTSIRGGGSKNPFCHSYDLSQRWCHDLNPHEASLVLPMLASSSESRQLGFLYYRQLVEMIESLLKDVTNRKVVRLLLYHPNVSILSVVLPLLLTHIRLHELPVVLLVAVQPWARRSCCTKSLTLVRRCSDVVLEVEGFAGRGSESYPPPPEFRNLHGLLRIVKLNTGTASTACGAGGGHFADTTTTKRPATTLYGLKRDRRKLVIQLLHIPPEDYAPGGSSVGGGGVRSGAGRGNNSQTGTKATGCASGSGSSVLDF